MRINENRTYIIAYVRLKRGDYETRLFKITYNKSKPKPYRFYVGQRMIGDTDDIQLAHKMLLKGIENYCDFGDGWEIQTGHFYEKYWI